MRILVVSQYFWPETFLINDLVTTLVESGHEVVVATGKPNYPQGRIFEGYRAEGIQRERFDDTVEVIRVPLIPRRSGGAWNLLVNYVSFAVSSAWHHSRLLGDRQFDVILAFAPSPILAAIPGVVLKWRTKAHLAIWIQDLWPESLEATGYIRSRPVLRSVGLLVRAIYAAADTLFVQSQAFASAVARRADPDKIVYLPNSVRLARPSGTPTHDVPRELLDVLSSRFCVVFAGNIGEAQAMETIVDVADLLRDVPDIRFVILGSGSRSAWLERAMRERHLDNIVIGGRLPPSAMGDIYAVASALLVTLKRREIFSYTVPSKVQAYLAAGRPIIAALDGEGARIVREAGAGMTCAAEDAAALAGCIQALHQLPEADRQRMGDAGRRYFLKHFEMRTQTQRMIEILERRIGGGR